ncbi:hypothetical protein M2390_002939 [Mycetocola sp. BIGb0189]|uniref:hypothetical protein n=1 Tax=Mycetocola sp. BIGb0189 TaxID=2940604 RepID=UPI002167C849|nr:hypothetical protein [Mycetocola sp. BIGb0189]MCS4277730.1 hypothetical protein [Mycetocola sp. BIGb0189]
MTTPQHILDRIDARAAAAIERLGTETVAARPTPPTLREELTARVMHALDRTKEPTLVSDLDAIGQAVLYLLGREPAPQRPAADHPHNWDVVTEENQAMTKAKPFLYQYLRCVSCGERREIPE